MLTIERAEVAQDWIKLWMEVTKIEGNIISFEEACMTYFRHVNRLRKQSRK